MVIFDERIRICVYRHLLMDALNLILSRFMYECLCIGQLTAKVGNNNNLARSTKYKCSNFKKNIYCK